MRRKGERKASFLDAARTERSKKPTEVGKGAERGGGDTLTEEKSPSGIPGEGGEKIYPRLYD